MNSLLDELALHLLGLLLVDRLLDLLDERQNVAHAENADGRAIGMERLERVDLLAHADELQRLPGDVSGWKAPRRRAHRHPSWSG